MDDDAPLDGSGAAAAAAKGKKPARAPVPFTDAVIAELSSKRKLTVGTFRGQARATLHGAGAWRAD